MLDAPFTPRMIDAPPLWIKGFILHGIPKGKKGSCVLPRVAFPFVFAYEENRPTGNYRGVRIQRAVPLIGQTDWQARKAGVFLLFSSSVWLIGNWLLQIGMFNIDFHKPLRVIRDVHVVALSGKVSRLMILKGRH